MFALASLAAAPMIAYDAPPAPSSAPEMVGASGYYNDTTNPVSNVAIPLPVGSLAGDLCVVFEVDLGNTSANPPAGFGQVGDTIARLSATAGENYIMVIASDELEAGHISTGSITVPQLGAKTGAIVAVFRNATTVSRSAGFERSASLVANSLALPTMTAPADGLAVAMCCRGGGQRTPAITGNWTVRMIQQSTISGIARYAVMIATHAAENGSSTPAGTWSISGAADQTLTAEVMTIT